MSELVESPKNVVTLKCPLFSDDEKNELEAFLKSQRGVEDVRRVMFTKDHALDRDTLGLITQTPWDLVIVLGNSVKEAVPYVVSLGTLYLMARKDRKQEDKDRKQQEDGDTEVVALSDQYGRTVRMVRKPKDKAAL